VLEESSHLSDPQKLIREAIRRGKIRVGVRPGGAIRITPIAADRGRSIEDEEISPTRKVDEPRFDRADLIHHLAERR
jgi:hypothetical protein